MEVGGGGLHDEGDRRVPSLFPSRPPLSLLLHRPWCRAVPNPLRLPPITSSFSFLHRCSGSPTPRDSLIPPRPSVRVGSSTAGTTLTRRRVGTRVFWVVRDCLSGIRWGIGSTRSQRGRHFTRTVVVSNNFYPGCPGAAPPERHGRRVDKGRRGVPVRF